MRIVVLALVTSLPSVTTVAMFGLFEYLVFAIMGVQLFSGKMHSCSNPVCALSCRQIHHFAVLLTG